MQKLIFLLVSLLILSSCNRHLHLSIGPTPKGEKNVSVGDIIYKGKTQRWSKNECEIRLTNLGSTNITLAHIAVSYRNSSTPPGKTVPLTFIVKRAQFISIKDVKIQIINFTKDKLTFMLIEPWI